MKKGLCILLFATMLVFCSCGSGQTTTPETTQQEQTQKSNHARDLSTKQVYPELSEDATVEMGNAFVKYFDEAFAAKSIDDVPEDFLTAAAYFYWNFDTDSVESMIGEDVWLAYEMQEDGLQQRYEELMNEAKELFEKEAGFTF